MSEYDEIDIEQKSDKVIDHQPGFIQLPKLLITQLGKELTPLGFAVYASLKLHAGYETHTCFVLIKTIAKNFGMGESTVRRELGKLEKMGLILRQNRKGQSSIYELPILEYSGAPRYGVAHPPLQYSGHPATTELHKEKVFKENKPNTFSPNGELPLSLNGEPEEPSRHEQFKKLFIKYWDKANPGIKHPWGPADGKQLKEFLKENPDLPLTGDNSFYSILLNRYNSERVTHSTPLCRWIRNCMIYVNGPLNQFNRPLEEKD